MGGGQALKFGMVKYHKNLKISLFVCCRSYLVLFGFVLLRLSEYLVFIDLYIVVFKAFEKIWIWYFILKQIQINIGCCQAQGPDHVHVNSR